MEERIEEIANRVKPKRVRPPRNRPAPSGTVNMTFEQLQQLLEMQSEAQAEAMKQFGVELRKPTPEEAAKIEDDKLRKARARAERIAMIEAEAEGIRLHQQNCGARNHTKDNGRTAIGGQIHNDGLYHPFCQRCNLWFTPVKPTADMLSGGVGALG